MKKEIISDFITKFNNIEYASKNEIRDFLSAYYLELSNSSFLWRLFELKEKGIITKISNDKYQINALKHKQSFTISLPNDIVVKTLMKFNESLDNIHAFSDDEKMISIWSLNVLNSFTSHQYSKEIVFVEIDKFRIDELFFELKDKLNGKYYVSKEYNKDYDHIVLENKVVVINPLLKRAPLEKRDLRKNHYVVSPKMEKVLVDLFAQKEIFGMYDRASIKEIFMNYYEKYNLDFTTLLYYAKNRGIKEIVRPFVSQILEVELDDK